MLHQGHDDSSTRGIQLCTDEGAGVFSVNQDTFIATTPTIAERKKPFHTFSRALLSTNYSTHLIGLVHACLAYLPSQRLISREVLAYTTQVLADLDIANANAPDDIRVPIAYGSGVPVDNPDGGIVGVRVTTSLYLAPIPI
jgi:hypothetical protein